MRFTHLLAAVSVATTFGIAAAVPAEAHGRCRAPGGFCGPQPVSHFIYYPRYSNVYQWATLAPYPGAYAYMPRGYYSRYYRPYGQYARRYWAPRRARAPVYVAAPVAAPAADCCDGGYLK
ncbi:hypothetical protein [Hyphomicrobium sulfonivorans]|uniref:hypothetical protein n=1 Tax=Hyphomicrobium sulfonivorans TaxID=121290 RepID=UPI00156E29D4|nr:hypothetical protein [Hyphomicrobium sulfonivorans]MBI1650900.1 hypothetical protein [Hyphomicrobium sulfonivorans]